MYQIRNGFIAHLKQDPEWGNFIAPDRELELIEDPNQKYNMPLGTAQYVADFSPYMKDAEFAAIVAPIVAQRGKINYEDQCSAKYYYDIFNVIRAERQSIHRVIDLGTMYGGSACIFAGCVGLFGMELDLVDINRKHLLLSYERIRRAFPQAISKIRLFLGTLPMYIEKVIQSENQTNIVLHHDASHNFNEVVNDLAQLSFVKEKMSGLIIQDTHLRCTNTRCAVFVDMALYAIFGLDFKGYGIGTTLDRTWDPGSASGSYFIDNQIEGWYLRFAENQFHYPHPSPDISPWSIRKSPKTV